MNIEIKKCELTDSNINAVIALSKEWEDENLTYGYCADNRNDIYGNDLFIVCSSDEIIGYLFGKCSVLKEAVDPIEKGARCFEMDEIFVKKEYRSQGIGESLFAYVENYYKQTVEYITLSTATKIIKVLCIFI